MVASRRRRTREAPAPRSSVPISDLPEWVKDRNAVIALSLAEYHFDQAFYNLHRPAHNSDGFLIAYVFKWVGERGPVPPEFGSRTRESILQIMNEARPITVDDWRLVSDSDRYNSDEAVRITQDIQRNIFLDIVRDVIESMTRGSVITHATLADMFAPVHSRACWLDREGDHLTKETRKYIRQLSDDELPRFRWGDGLLFSAVSLD